MNKSIIVSIVGIVFIIVFSIFIQNYLKKSSDKLLIVVDSIVKAVYNEENDILIVEEKFNKSWKKTKSYWAILINHEEIDNIEELIKRIEILVKSAREREEVLAELNKLRFYIAHIPEKEEFSIRNIL
ncbi:MAG: DUF4363 family protein [Clostridia bacterium]|nr:DUF4363 family protein [Clostridia bacterium]